MEVIRLGWLPLNTNLLLPVLIIVPMIGQDGEQKMEKQLQQYSNEHAKLKNYLKYFENTLKNNTDWKVQRDAYEDEQ